MTPTDSRIRLPRHRFQHRAPSDCRKRSGSGVSAAADRAKNYPARRGIFLKRLFASGFSETDPRSAPGICRPLEKGGRSQGVCGGNRGHSGGQERQGFSGPDPGANRHSPAPPDRGRGGGTHAARGSLGSAERDSRAAWRWTSAGGPRKFFGSKMEKSEKP